MRITNKTRLLFGVILLAGILFPSLVRAFSQKDTAAEYVMLGQNSLKAGKAELAVEPLIKALLLEPDAAVARQELQRLASSLRLLSPTQQFQVKRFLELSEYLQFLYARLSYVRQKNREIYDVLSKENILSAAVQKTLQVFAPKSEQEATLPLALSSLLGRKNVPFEEYNRALLSQKDSVFLSLNEGLSTNRELRRISSELVTHRKEQLDRIASPANNAVPDSHIKITPGSQGVAADNASWVQQDVITLRSHLELLQTRLQTAENRLAELTKNIAGMSLELYEKNKIVDNKDQQLSRMVVSLSEAEARLTLVQRIMQEKDNQIRTLETEISKIQQDIESGSARQEMRTLVQDELKFQGEAQQKQITELGQQFDALQSKHVLLENELKIKSEELAKLQDVVSNNENLIKRYELIVVSKDEKLLELNGILQLYKGRLDDTCAILKEAEDRIKTLQNQFEQGESTIPGNAAELKTPEQNAPPDEKTIHILPPGNSAPSSETTAVFERTMLDDDHWLRR